MLRMVLLRHSLPDGEWHYDWMIERAPGLDPQERALLTFRVAEHPARPVGPPLRAARLGDHRRLYLSHEGEVAGGRGEVRRVAAGWARGVDESLDSVRIEGRFEGVAGVFRWVGVRRAEDEWEFAVHLLA